VKTPSTEIVSLVALVTLTLGAGEIVLHYRNLNVRSNSSRIFTNATIQVNRNLKDEGSLTIIGCDVSVGGSLILGNSRKSSASMTIIDSQFSQPYASAFLGVRGKGHLIISNSALTFQNPVVGYRSHSAGTVTVTGGQVTSLGDVICGFGRSSTGQITVAGGQVTSLGDVICGFGRSSTGQILILDGTLESVSGGIRLSEEGFGRLVLSNGTARVAKLFIGDAIASYGAVLIDGGSLTVPEISVGHYSTGVFDLSNGTVQAQLATVGYAQPNPDVPHMTTGTLTIAGGVMDVDSILGSVLAGDRSSILISGGTLLGGGIDFGVNGQSIMTVLSGLVTNEYINVYSYGTLSVEGGEVETETLFLQPNFPSSVPHVWIKGGKLGTSYLLLADPGGGVLTLSNGVLNAGSINVRAGTLTIAGGSTIVTRLQAILVGEALEAATGTVWITGGTLDVPNGYINVGQQSPGIMVVSNGFVHASSLFVESARFPGGGLHVDGGIIEVDELFQVRGDPLYVSTGSVWITGGQLVVTSATAQVGWNYETGRLVISNGTILASNLEVGANGGRGLLILAGGTIVCTNVNVLGLGSLGGRGTISGSVNMQAGASLNFALENYLMNGQLVAVGKNAVLAGTLAVRCVNGFEGVITNGTSIRLLSANTISGTFDNVADGGRLQSLDGSGDFLVTYDASNIWLSDFQRAP
jgi:hypothetical protein